MCYANLLQVPRFQRHRDGDGDGSDGKRETTRKTGQSEARKKGSESGRQKTDDEREVTRRPGKCAEQRREKVKGLEYGDRDIQAKSLTVMWSLIGP